MAGEELLKQVMCIIKEKLIEGISWVWQLPSNVWGAVMGRKNKVVLCNSWEQSLTDERDIIGRIISAQYKEDLSRN
jgi:hypothetical protein